MNQGNIHTEVLVSIIYNKSTKKYKHLQDHFIDEVEKISSYCTGGDGSFVLSAYKDNVTANNLIEIVMVHILSNIDAIEIFKFEIYRYNEKGHRVKKRKYGFSCEEILGKKMKKN